SLIAAGAAATPATPRPSPGHGVRQPDVRVRSRDGATQPDFNDFARVGQRHGRCNGSRRKEKMPMNNRLENVLGRNKWARLKDLAVVLALVVGLGLAALSTGARLQATMKPLAPAADPVVETTVASKLGGSAASLM